MNKEKLTNIIACLSLDVFLVSFMLIVPADSSCLAKGSNRCIFLTKILDFKDDALFVCQRLENVAQFQSPRLGNVTQFLSLRLGNILSFYVHNFETLLTFYVHNLETLLNFFKNSSTRIFLFSLFSCT